jgi:hypothetical protein
MNDTTILSDTAVHSRLPVPESSRNPQREAGASEGRRAANPSRRRLDRLSLGRWLGGAVLGLVGCVFGTRLLGRRMKAGRGTRGGEGQGTSTRALTKWPRYVPLPREEMVLTTQKGRPGSGRGEPAITETGRGQGHQE